MSFAPWGGHMSPAEPEVGPYNVTPAIPEVRAGHMSVTKPEVGGSRLPKKPEVAHLAIYTIAADANLPQG